MRAPLAPRAFRRSLRYGGCVEEHDAPIGEIDEIAAGPPPNWFKRTASGLAASFKAGLSREGRWPILWGGFFFLLAQLTDFYGQLVPGAAHDAKGEADAARLASAVFSNETLYHLFVDFGSAFVVAWVVSMAIERNSRLRQELLLNRAQRAIAKEVFNAIYNLRHDRKYVEAAIEGVLGTHFIRENYEVIYKLAPYSQKEQAAAGVDLSRFVRLRAISQYSIKNVTPNKEHFRMRASIPVRNGPLADLSKLTSLRIGSKAHSQTEIDALLDDSIKSDRCYLIQTDVDGNSDVQVVVEVEVVKELSDSESLGLKLPTLAMKVSLIIENIDGLEFDLRGYTSSPVQSEVRSADNKTATWKLPGPMLPWNSLVLWWRTPQDDTGANGHLPESVRPPSPLVVQPAAAQRAPRQKAAAQPKLPNARGKKTSGAKVENQPKLQKSRKKTEPKLPGTGSAT